jgi:long-chain fatty acid transport protein
MSQFRATLALAAVAGAMNASPAHAGAYYLQEQSATEIGRGLAGGAAAADDATVLAYNPAAITALDGVQVAGGTSAIFATTRQRDAGTTRSGPGAVPAVAAGGGNGGNPFDSLILVPNFYVSAPIADRLWAGFAATAPFGLKLDYADDFFGRYDSTYSKLTTYNLQPSLAYKVSDHVSVGGGIDVQYAKATLVNALPNLTPGSPDGRLDVSGDDWAVGWNAGLFYDSPTIRAGLHYRSGVKHDLKGRYVISGLAGPLAAANVDTAVAAPLDLPDIVTASVSARVRPDLRLMLTGRWYNWSVFRGLRLRPEGRAEQFKELDYKDSWSVGAGADYAVTPRVALRAGAMFDRTPVNRSLQTTRVPDGNRTWLTLGAGLRISDRATIDLAAAHVFVDPKPMDRADPFYTGTAAAITVDTRATSSAHVDMISVGMAYRF